MYKKFTYCLIAALLIPSFVFGQKYTGEDGKIKVALVLNPYNGDRAGPELDFGPERMANSGIKEILLGMGAVVQRVSNVKLSPEEDKEYGRWNRLGIANGHLGEFAAENEKNGMFNVGLYNNCSSLSGMLAGLQHSGPPRRPLKVGLVFIDAHGDYNTPETTLSGMLGGMPVAVAGGDCLTRLRLQSGLDPALPSRYIVMACVRDTDPLEQERIDNSFIEHITVADIINKSDNITKQMDRLSRLTDIIYIHIDMDVLDPPEVMGHPLTVPNGPTSQELADALEIMFTYEKSAALGIASLPEDDKDDLSLTAAYNLIQGAVRGIQKRK